MKQYTVYIPITMEIEVTITATNQQEAENKALDLPMIFDVATTQKGANPNILQIESHRNITNGNTCHAVRNNIEVKEKTKP